MVLQLPFKVDILTDIEDPIADMDFSFVGTSSTASTWRPSAETITEAKTTLRQILTLDIFCLSETQKHLALSAISTIAASTVSPTITDKLNVLSSTINSVFSSFKSLNSRATELRRDIGEVMSKKEQEATLLGDSKECVKEGDDLRTRLKLKEEWIQALKVKITFLE